MLTIDNLSYSRKRNVKDYPILKGFQFQMETNSSYAFMGRNGCGKTTLANLIAGYLKPSSGRIIMNDLEITSTGPERIIINQEHDLFDWMTVYENMKIINKDDKAVTSCLRLLNIYEYKDFYPRKLSGGMKKRLSIARALLLESQLIIFDEAFSSLDIHIAEDLQEEILEMKYLRNVSLLIITHNFEEALYLSDYICFFSGPPLILIKKIRNPFPHPRDQHIKESNDFVKTVSHLRTLLRDI